MSKLPPVVCAPIKPYNDHMNVTYYVLVFDMAGEEMARSLCLGEAVTRETGFSWAVLENHITFLLFPMGSVPDLEARRGQNARVQDASGHKTSCISEDRICCSE